ncbi:mitochondrial carrier domain-containing protein [Hyaloraphidium curvatum]|nr:mitochondrial carrier domain-containing protein [Hyaloraphidium curvatum]
MKYVFEQLDYDGDGFLEVWEVRRLLLTLRGLEDFGTPEDDAIASLAPRFEESRVHVVSAELLAQYLKEALETLKEEESQERTGLFGRLRNAFQLRRAPSDRIDYTTFKKLLLLMERRAWDLYQAIDVNKDGLLSPAEIKRAALLEGIRLRLNDAERFVAALDRNHDGSVDFREFRRFMLTIPAILERDYSLADIFSAFQFVYQSNIEFDHVPWGLEKDALKQEQLRYFLAGAFAGAFSRTVTAPIDRLRIYFMVQTAADFASVRAEGLVPAARHVVRNFRSAVMTILRDGGIASFFRGNFLNCCRIVPESAIGFLVQEVLGDDFDPDEDDVVDAFLDAAGRRFVSGAAAGTLGQFCAYPIETIRMRVMVGHATVGIAIVAFSTASLPNPVDPRHAGGSRSLILAAVEDIYVKAGLLGFYRGIIPATMGMAPFMGTNMAVFETLKKWWKRRKRYSNNPSLGQVQVLAFGCISGSVAASLVYPLQLVRGSTSLPAQYKNVRDCFRQTYAKEGLRGFYRGLAISLSKVAPATGLAFLSYEHAKHLLGVG